MSRRRFVAANWKMHKSVGEAVAFARDFLPLVKGASAEIAIAPPFTALAALGEALAGSNVALAAQNVHDEAKGAFTGEIAPGMLVDVGCAWGIVGHSERRALFAETDAFIARKAAALFAAGLRPIVCVGETLAEREAGQTEAVVDRQLGAVLAVSTANAFQRAVIAYEPVWAIGTGRNATPEQAQAVHAFIRGQVAARDQAASTAVNILYGGSVKGGNATELLAQPDIDGGLVGGASLNAAEFLAICRAAVPGAGRAQR